MEPINWLSLAAFSLLAAMVPGSSFTYIVNVGVTKGEKAAYCAVTGHSLAMCLYSILAMLSLDYLSSESSLFFEIFKVVGGLFLLRLAYKSLIQDSNSKKNTHKSETKGAFWASFLLSMLNPKILLLLAAMFSNFVVTDMSLLNKTAIVNVAVVADSVWYMFVVWAMHNWSLDRVLKENKLRLVQASALLFSAFGISLIYDAVSYLG